MTFIVSKVIDLRTTSVKMKMLEFGIYKQQQQDKVTKMVLVVLHTDLVHLKTEDALNLHMT